MNHRQKYIACMVPCFFLPNSENSLRDSKGVSNVRLSFSRLVSHTHIGLTLQHTYLDTLTISRIV